jgi:hypothetical protein
MGESDFLLSVSMSPLKAVPPFYFGANHAEGLFSWRCRRFSPIFPSTDSAEQDDAKEGFFLVIDRLGVFLFSLCRNSWSIEWFLYLKPLR